MSGVLVAAGASILCGGVAHADEDSDSPEAGPVAGRNVGLVVIDNSHADSWLEIDRTLNTLINSQGTAGSDHDGGGGAIDVQAGNTSGSGDGTGDGSGTPTVRDPAPAPAPVAALMSLIGQIGHPPWQGENGE